MTDEADRPTLTDEDVAKRYGKHRVTVGLWRRRGVRSAGGGLVRLQSQKVGGTYYTSEKQLAEFLRRLNDPAAPSTPAEAAR